MCYKCYFIISRYASTSYATQSFTIHTALFQATAVPAALSSPLFWYLNAVHLCVPPRTSYACKYALRFYGIPKEIKWFLSVFALAAQGNLIWISSSPFSNFSDSFESCFLFFLLVSLPLGIIQRWQWLGMRGARLSRCQRREWNELHAKN